MASSISFILITFHWFLLRQVDPLASPKKNLELFYMFVNLLKVEQEVIQKVRDTEEEVSVFIQINTGVLFLPQYFAIREQ